MFLSDVSLSAPPPRSEYPVMPPTVRAEMPPSVRSRTTGTADDSARSLRGNEAIDEQLVGHHAEAEHAAVFGSNYHASCLPPASFTSGSTAINGSPISLVHDRSAETSNTVHLPDDWTNARFCSVSGSENGSTQGSWVTRSESPSGSLSKRKVRSPIVSSTGPKSVSG